MTTKFNPLGDRVATVLIIVSICDIACFVSKGLPSARTRTSALIFCITMFSRYLARWTRATIRLLNETAVWIFSVGPSEVTFRKKGTLSISLLIRRWCKEPSSGGGIFSISSKVSKSWKAWSARAVADNGSTGFANKSYMSSYIPCFGLRRDGLMVSINCSWTWLKGSRKGRQYLMGCICETFSISCNADLISAFLFSFLKITKSMCYSHASAQFIVTL